MERLGGCFGDAGILVDEGGNPCTIFAKEHLSAQILLANRTDIHTLARQMSTSVLMLEGHNSKLMATMAAEKLA
jgi:integrase